MQYIKRIHNTKEYTNNTQYNAVHNTATKNKQNKQNKKELAGTSDPMIATAFPRCTATKSLWSKYMVELVSLDSSCTRLPSSCRNTLDWGPMAPEDSMATVCFVCFVFFVCSKTNKTNKTKKVLAGTSAPHDSHRIPPLHSHRKPLEQVHGGVGVTQYQLHMPPQLL